MAIDRRRIGQFLLSEVLLETADNLSVLMNKITPIRVEHLYYNRAFHYLAYSELFEAVPEGDMASWYEMVLTRHEDGGVSVKAVRCEKPLL